MVRPLQLTSRAAPLKGLKRPWRINTLAVAMLTAVACASRGSDHPGDGISAQTAGQDGGRPALDMAHAVNAHDVMGGRGTAGRMAAASAAAPIGVSDPAEPDALRPDRPVPDFGGAAPDATPQATPDLAFDASVAATVPLDVPAALRPATAERVRELTEPVGETEAPTPVEILGRGFPGEPEPAASRTSALWWLLSIGAGGVLGLLLWRALHVRRVRAAATVAAPWYEDWCAPAETNAPVSTADVAAAPPAREVGADGPVQATPADATKVQGESDGGKSRSMSLAEEHALLNPGHAEPDAGTRSEQAVAQDVSHADPGREDACREEHPDDCTYGWEGFELQVGWPLDHEDLMNWHEWRWPISVMMELVPPGYHDGAHPAHVSPPLLPGVEPPHAVQAVPSTATLAPETAPPKTATREASSQETAPRRPALRSPAPRASAAPEQRLPAPSRLPSAVSLPARAGSPWEQRVEQLCTVATGILARCEDPDVALPCIEITIDARPPAAALVQLDEVEEQVLSAEFMDAREAWQALELLRLQLRFGARARLDAVATLAGQVISVWQPQADEHLHAGWQAQRIRMHLARIHRDAAAAGLRSLRALRTSLQPDVQCDGPAPLKAWLDVLWHWGTLVRGSAAQEIFDEAVALCEALRVRPGQADAAQRLLGLTLVRRAEVEQGAARLACLDQALRLHDDLHARTQLPTDALIVAQTALAHLRIGAPRSADAMCTHALSHAFLAGMDAQHTRRSLQCRLQVQLAYESLPGVPVQGDVALGLVRALDTGDTLSLQTVEHMVAVLERHGDDRRICELCDLASREGQRSFPLQQAWSAASRRWAAAARDSDRTAWQNNARQLHLLAR